MDWRSNGSDHAATRFEAMSRSQSQPTFAIRQAASNDGEPIVACLASAFAPYRDKYTPAAFRDTVLDSESVQDRLREMRVFVAVADGRVVGTIACALNGGEGHLRGMGVVPEWQGRGVASALLDAAERDVRERHGIRVTLDTTEPLARAMAFYERHGFIRSGRVSKFFGMPLHEWVKQL